MRSFYDGTTSTGYAKQAGRAGALMRADDHQVRFLGNRVIDDCFGDASAGHREGRANISSAHRIHRPPHLCHERFPRHRIHDSHLSGDPTGHDQVVVLGGGVNVQHVELGFVPLGERRGVRQGPQRRLGEVDGAEDAVEIDHGIPHSYLGARGAAQRRSAFSSANRMVARAVPLSRTPGRRFRTGRWPGNRQSCVCV
jgi:hypothetical protein